VSFSLIIAAQMQIAVFTTKYAATTAQSSPENATPVLLIFDESFAASWARAVRGG